MAKPLKIYVKNDDDSTVISVRLKRTVDNQYQEIANKTNRSKNEILNTALEYALNYIEIISEESPINE
jgi:predicted transcriptional regulator